MFSQIFYGFLGIAAGLAMIRYALPVQRFTGDWGWAERYLGSGGTISAIKLVGIFICFLGFLKMTGMLENFLGGTVGQILPAPAPGTF